MGAVAPCDIQHLAATLIPRRIIHIPFTAEHRLVGAYFYFRGISLAYWQDQL